MFHVCHLSVLLVFCFAFGSAFVVFLQETSLVLPTFFWVAFCGAFSGTSVGFRLVCWFLFWLALCLPMFLDILVVLVSEKLSEKLSYCQVFFFSLFSFFFSFFSGGRPGRGVFLSAPFSSLPCKASTLASGLGFCFPLFPLPPSLPLFAHPFPPLSRPVSPPSRCLLLSLILSLCLSMSLFLAVSFSFFPFSVWLFVCLRVFLSVCLSVFVSVCCLSVCRSVCLCVCLLVCSVWPSFCLFVFCLFVRPFVPLVVRLSVFLLSLSIFFLSLACFFLSLSFFCVHCLRVAYRTFRVKGLQLEVSELLPQELLACGNQTFIATLLCDPSMSALPIVETLTSKSVG